jgi:hypothetical protein
MPSPRSSLIALLWVSVAAAPISGQWEECWSSVSAAYTPDKSWLTYASGPIDLSRVTDLRNIRPGVPALPPHQNARSAVLARFEYWIVRTGQYGAWNDIMDRNISCYENRVQRTLAPGRSTRSDGDIAELRMAVLPANWAYVPPSEISASEVARLRTRTPTAGSSNPGVGLVITDPANSRYRAERQAELRARAVALARVSADRLRASPRYQTLKGEWATRRRALVNDGSASGQ